MAGLVRARSVGTSPPPSWWDPITEKTGLGFLLLDSAGLVVDASPGASRILNRVAPPLGEPLAQILPPLANAWSGLEGNPLRFALEGTGPRFLEARVHSFTDPRQPLATHLIVLQDITQHWLAEETAREQRVLAEALRDTALAMNSTLDLDEVLDNILNNIERVVPSDLSNIMLIDDGGFTHIARYRGYTGEWADVLERLSFKVSETRNLQQMVETRRPMVIPDTNRVDWWVRIPQVRLRAYLAAPVSVRGEVVGFINLDNETPGYYTSIHAEHLQAFAHQAGIAIANARMYTEMQQLATVDGLTGLINRRHFQRLAENAIGQALRSKRPLSLMLMDIDHFKRVNDTYGHTYGDEVLQVLARQCLQSLRRADIVGRYGGEEFVVLLPDTNGEQACRAAEHLRQVVASTVLTHPQGDVRLTVSLGVMGMDNGHQTLASLVECADRALLAAKDAGRDRVYLHGERTPRARDST